MRFRDCHLKVIGLFCLVPLLGFLLTGCDTTQAPTSNHPVEVAHLHVGDTVTVSYDGPPTPIPPHEESIKEDGTITLDDIGSVQAVGKTLGELQYEIYTNYVPRYYTHLTVTVTTSGDRVYYVEGEVGHPGEELYRDALTVTRAITAAGDFTDFANRKKILLIRANGERLKLDGQRILDGEDPDPSVYPGDIIKVFRRYW